MTEQAVTSLPLIGEKAPSFKAKTTQGEIDFPKCFEGKWGVFFSHPADFTPVCTTEFMTFASMAPEFEKRNCKLLGLSIDSIYAHIAWLRTILYYPLSNRRNMDEVMRLLVAMQTSDAHGIATPANWRPGDDVIVPPPGSCGVAKERTEKADPDVKCLDWFMCLKKCPPVK